MRGRALSALIGLVALAVVVGCADERSIPATPTPTAVPTALRGNTDILEPCGAAGGEATRACYVAEAARVDAQGAYFDALDVWELLRAGNATDALCARALATARTAVVSARAAKTLADEAVRIATEAWNREASRSDAVDEYVTLKVARRLVRFADIDEGGPYWITALSERCLP